MSLVTDRALSAREFLDECIAFKRDRAAQSRFLRGLVLGKLNEPQLKQWAKDFYYYVEPAIPTVAAWLASAPILPDREIYKLIARNLAKPSAGSSVRNRPTRSSSDTFRTSARIPT